LNDKDTLAEIRTPSTLFVKVTMIRSDSSKAGLAAASGLNTEAAVERRFNSKKAGLATAADLTTEAAVQSLCRIKSKKVGLKTKALGGRVCRVAAVGGLRLRISLQAGQNSGGSSKIPEVLRPGLAVKVFSGTSVPKIIELPVYVKVRAALEDE
jgi:hypothetical protein